MLDLTLAIIWGSILERIRNLLNQTEELYLGLFINSLTYENEIKGKEEKTKYLLSLKTQIDKINKEIKTFNRIRIVSFGHKSLLEKLPLIDFSRMKEIVNRHKGDYPKEKGINRFAEELLGRTDSASSLSRKHTALQLRNILLPLRMSMGRFVESLKKNLEPYQEYELQKNKFRPIISREIDKSIICYSVNLKEESVFIIGRLLENLCSEWLTILKKQKNPLLKEISIKDLDFDQKLTRLHYTLKKINPSQYSKAMALKWDRNTFGHEINGLSKLSKECDSNIKNGINLIILFESKIKGRKSIPEVIKAVKYK